MKQKLKATFGIDTWDEQPIDVRDATSTMTRVIATKTYEGDISGTSFTEWVMSYASNGTATFVGLERIVGVIGERAGTVVLQHVGTFADGAATAELTVAPGAASGELEHVTGTGSFTADPAGSVALQLTYED
jgi:hypothetical protein